jgi:hypothetical protein
MLSRPPHTTVTARTLNSILRQLDITKIDLLSLDVEGYELEALGGFDLQFYHPTYVIVEVANKFSKEILSLFHDCGYSVLDNLTNYDHATAAIWENSYNDLLFKYNASNT